jgi:hypothetical protein
VLILNNVATTDDYSRETTLESEFGGRLVYLVANESVVARFRPIVELGGSQAAEYGLEQVLTPQSSFIDKISGVKFRSAVAGSPGRIVATLSEPGDILPASGTPFSGVLAASGGVSGALIGLYDLSVSDVTVQNTAVETSIYSKLITGGDLTALGGLRGHIYCNYADVDGAQTLRIRLKYGGTTICDTGVINYNNGSGDNAPFDIEFEVQNAASVIAQEGILKPTLWFGGVTNPTSRTRLLVGTAAINSQADQVLDVTVQWGAASGSNVFLKQWARLDLIK